MLNSFITEPLIAAEFAEQEVSRRLAYASSHFTSFPRCQAEKLSGCSSTESDPTSLDVDIRKFQKAGTDSYSQIDLAQRPIHPTQPPRIHSYRGQLTSLTAILASSTHHVTAVETFLPKVFSMFISLPVPHNILQIADKDSPHQILVQEDFLKEL